jgi:hypothetical protein
MLRKIHHLSALFAAASVFVVVLAAPAMASSGSGGCDANQQSPTCEVGVISGGTGGSVSPGPTTGTPSGFTPGPTTCTSDGQSIPCETSDGWWSGQSSNCSGYVRLAVSQLPPPSGRNAGAGAWYTCTTYCPAAATTGRDCPGGTFWSDTPPAGITTYTPAQAAAALVKTFQLTGISIGMAPESKTHSDDAVGIAPYRRTWVGIPVWLWVDNPQPLNFGPYTQSATLGGVTVTATAHVSSITWLSGDGQTINCGTGTAFNETAMKDELAIDSPTCGFRYQKDSGTGTSTVTAISRWVVQWTGGGVTGTLAAPSVRSITPVRVGQLESVNTVAAANGFGY